MNEKEELRRQTRALMIRDFDKYREPIKVENKDLYDRYINIVHHENVAFEEIQEVLVALKNFVKHLN